MNSNRNYVNLKRVIFINFDKEFDHITKNILNEIFDIYYLERDVQLYNIDNAFKKCNMDMYNLLSKKYTLTKSKKNIFIKHKYNKKEYTISLLKKMKALF